jgi:hypothetical protein
MGLLGALINRFKRYSLVSVPAFLMLLICLSACQKKVWQPADSSLATPWIEDVQPDSVLPEYPRPQMVREEWLNLNGLWDFAVLPREEGKPERFTETILVPFPIESALSGLGRRVTEDERLWYRRKFKMPASWGARQVLLHFGAVDWDTAIYVNGREMQRHAGGYDGFSVDITPALEPGRTQEILVSVWDPSDMGGQPVGKQHQEPQGIWYTPSSGIWQTIWIEPVPDLSIAGFRLIPDVDGQFLKINLATRGEARDVMIEALAFSEGREVGRAQGQPGEDLNLMVQDLRLWTPDDPFLYELKLSLLRGEEVMDSVDSYFAMRKISIGPDDTGLTRILLNDEFIFQLGPLDQGFWPEGLYTAPTDEALRYDVDMMKKMGFNMVRKHVKVEPARWYYWCDRLGLLVWQDMPSGKNTTEEDKSQFEHELRNVILSLYNHPSIIMWVPFNEGWGQFDSGRIANWIKELDPSRLVNHASGWTDRGISDIKDIHSYPDPRGTAPEPARAAVLGEFGGLGFNVPDHTWQTEGWGYDLLPDFDELARRYESLYVKLLPMIADPGLSAAVYTQVSDIETENNGLMTYDRKVVKIEPEAMRLAQSGYLPPQTASRAFIFIGQTMVELTSFRRDVTLRYTLDGSDPGPQSVLYENPIQIDKTTTLKSRAYWDTGQASRISSFTFTKSDPRKSVMVEGSPGLTMDVFSGEWKSLPDFAQLSRESSSVVRTVGLEEEPGASNFALQFTGYVRIPKTGVYIFSISSDDGSRLIIGDRIVLDNDGVHGVREKSGAIGLEAGFHPIVFQYFQGRGERELKAFVEGGDLPRMEIPGSMLFH